jgi:hypothetical protein
MSESDLHEIGRAAADAAELPDFESLRARGRRRQTVRRTAWAGAAAIAVVGVIGVAQLAGSTPASAPITPVTPRPTVTSTAGPEPSPEPTDVASPQTPQPDPGAARIVDDPLAVLMELQVDPGNPHVMAALWQCTDIDCERLGAALALTGDGFATRTVYRVEGGGLFAALGSGTFHYKSNLGFGDLYRVPGIVGPAGSGGDVVSIGSGLHLWTLVTADGSSRPIENAEGFNQLVRSPGGGLTALGVDDAGHWVVARSTDIGATWDRQRLTGSAPAPLFGIIPSAAAPALMEESGGGATAAPLAATWRLEDSGQWVRYAAPAGDTAYTTGQVVLPDGRLLTAVESWSGGGQPGFYVSDGDDWSTLTRVQSPFPNDSHPYVLATSVSAGSATMVVADPEGDESKGWRTTDGGQTWAAVKLR